MCVSGQEKVIIKNTLPHIGKNHFLCNNQRERLWQKNFIQSVVVVHADLLTVSRFNI